MLLAALACGRGEVARQAEDEAPANEMCAEHGVLEAVCPKCNPALVPVFQAKGDWCAEHGFPMSFCPVHHPERGGRPAVDVSSDGAPADGLKVRLGTRDAARMAGILTVPARVAADEGGVEAVATLTWDATRHAIVTARAPGVVEAIRADVGAPVRKGDALAAIRSATVAAGRSAFGAAEPRVRIAEEALERKRSLMASGIASRREVVEAEQELAIARAELGALAAELGAVGRFTAEGYTLVAPIAGVVIGRDVTVGMGVDTSRPMFEIADPSGLWAEIAVPEADVGLVHEGQGVTLRVDGVADRAFAGTVSYVAPSIDPDSRTALARAAIDNRDGALRANMYGTARIAVGGAREVAVVPAAAVQRAKGVDLVFVRLADDVFETRRVRVVGRRGDEVSITGNVRAGEVVVTEGSFLLKTETLEDSIGIGCCDGD